MQLSQSAAKLISFVTEGIYVLVFAVLMLVIGKGPVEAAKGLAFVAVLALPPLGLYIFQQWRRVSRSRSLTRQERSELYLMAMVTSLANVAVFSFDPEWLSLAMVFTIFLGAFFVVNEYFDKASMHVGAYSFAVMLFVDKLAVSYALLFVVLPAIIWARLSLRKHTWLDIMWGLVIGLVAGLLSWTF